MLTFQHENGAFNAWKPSWLKKKRQGPATESQESNGVLCLVQGIVHDDEQAELLVTSGEGKNQLHR